MLYVLSIAAPYKALHILIYFSTPVWNPSCGSQTSSSQMEAPDIIILQIWRLHSGHGEYGAEQTH